MYGLLIVLLGLADRLRGGGWFRYSRPLGLLLMGILTAGMAGVGGLEALALIVAVIAGGAPGWGNPLGAALDRTPMTDAWEVWQRGILRRNVLSAVAVRGLIWGAPVALVSLPAGVAYAAGFTAAPYLVRSFLPPSSAVDCWGVMEFVRGALIASAFLALTI